MTMTEIPKANVNHQAEIFVLSACMQSATARKKCQATVSASDFDLLQHEIIWQAMVDLDKARKSVDVVNVLEAVRHNQFAMTVMPNLVTLEASPTKAETYASIVHGLAVARRVVVAARALVADVEGAKGDLQGVAASAATTFANIRDAGASPEVDALTLRELLAEQDEPYDWLIEGMLERGDRFMLTGEEGMGKSYLLRQIAICAAAGLHPFGQGLIKPCRVLIVDAENSKRQTKRAMRSLAQRLEGRGTTNPLDTLMIDTPGRLDITKDRELNRIHQMLDAQNPDILVIGPLYRLVPRALQTDDDTAPVLAALDTIKDRGIALLIEAHAGHGKGVNGTRDLRPRGSSSLLGWPEFGYGLRPDPEFPDQAILDKWRGDRDQRNWPEVLSRAANKPLPWSIVKFYGKPVELP